MSLCQNLTHLERLKSSHEFREIYRVGQKLTGKYFLLFYRPRQDERIQFGVTASRRLGNAVSRNRAKRLMREAVRHAVIETSPGYDFILVARGDILKTKMQSVRDQLSSQLHRCCRINGLDRSNQ